MSYTATRNPVAVRLRAAASIENDLYLEGLTLLNGRVIEDLADDREVTLETLQRIHTQDASHNRQSWYYEGGQQKFVENYVALDLAPLLFKKSKGACYMMRRVYYGRYRQFGLKEFAELKSEWAAVKELRHWFKSVSREDKESMDLSPSALYKIGCRFAWEADRFIALYRECYTKGRKWGSCYQPDKEKVLAIATTPNYNRLPLWVKKILVSAGGFSVGDRIGDIWRLIPCAKAWKHAPHLPKNLAEKVGKLGVKARILAGYAWNYAQRFRHRDDEGNYMPYYDENGNRVEWERSRAELVNIFWRELRRLLRLSLGELLREHENFDNGFETNILIQEAVGLPHGLIQSELGNKKKKLDVYLQFLTKYGSTSKEACNAIFGVSGKRTQALLKTANYKAVQWAMALFYGDADAIQKCLEMTDMVKFQSDTVDFLNSLPVQTRLKMLGTTTFKYRGEVHPISDDHVRDTGYLWNQFQTKPELGRVRCWFSVHETLATEYVKTLPDEPLPVNQEWERVDGLCSIDGAWELEFPRSVATLKDWGYRLRNLRTGNPICVGGYGPAIKSGRSIVFVVKEHGVPTHCVEVVNGNRVNQFYARGNSSPEPAIQDSVTAALVQARLLTDY